METLNLARRLELGPLPPAEAVHILSQVAQRVSQWHARGWLHRELSLDVISLGPSSDEVEVAEPAPQPILFGGPHWEPEKSPAEFSAIGPIFVPRDIPEAKAAFAGEKLKLDPVQIDVYQLGALCQRLLTGETVTAYLSSPKTRSRVPEAWRTLLDQALGSSRDRIGSAAAFAQALVSSEMPTQIGGDTVPADGLTAAAEQPLPFTRIGEYEIRGRIGHGGMGDVYQAFDERRNRMVAVKVLPAELARQTDFVRRFYAEAAAAARLVHPHIIEILYVGEDQGRHFFVMEYVAGESLGDRLARQKFLSVDEAVNITLQILSALEVAHQEGFVHRDIKPSNILLESAKRRAVLADFGLVKSLQEATGMTATGVVVGTVHYLSPEQARGRSIDGRSDLYSIGVLLYQMLSGELPFTGEGTTALIYQHLYEPPRPLIEVAPHVAPVLSVIVDKLLRKTPADRYASAEQLAGDLKAFLTDQPLPSGADIVDDDQDLDDDLADGEPGLDTTAIIAAPKFEYTPQIAIPEPPPEPEATPEPGTWWERIEQRLWKTLREQAPEFAASLQTVEQELDSTIDDLEEREKELRRLTKKALRLLQELRQQRNDWQTAAERAADDDQQLRAQQHIRELTQQIADQQEQLSAMRLQQAKVSATLERLRSQRDTLQARMKVVEASLKLSGWRRRRRLVKSLMVSAAVLVILAIVWVALDGPKIWNTMKTGASLASLLGQRAQELTLTTIPLGIPADQYELPQQKLQGVDGRVSAMTFSPDGGKVYLGFSDSRVGLWDLESGTPFRVQLNGGEAVSGLAIEPETGRLVSWQSYNRAGNIQIWPADLDGTPEFHRLDDLSQILVGSSLNECLVRYTRRTPGQNDRIQSTEELLLYDLNSNAALRTVAEDNYPAAYDPKSHTAAYVTIGDGALHVWSLETKSETRVIPEFVKQNVYPRMAISPDGHLLAARQSPNASQPSITIWNLETGSREMEYRIYGKAIYDLAFHPSSKMLAVAGPDLVELWDLKQRKVVKLFQAQAIHQIAFSPDGQLLAAAVGQDQPAVVIWDAAPPVQLTTGNVVTLPGHGPAAINEDGTRYAAMDGGDIVLRELKTQKEVQRVKIGAGKVKQIDLSSDCELGAVAMQIDQTALGQLTLADLKAGEVVHTCRGELHVALEPQRHTLYYVEGNSLMKYEPETRETTVVARNEIEPGVMDMAISPRHDWAALSGWHRDERRSFVTMVSLSGAEPTRRLPINDHYVWCVAFAPNGSQLASGSKTYVTLWDVESGRELKKIYTGKNWVEGLALSPDGKSIATGFTSGGTCIFSGRTGRQQLEFRLTTNEAVTSKILRFTPDGRYLFSTAEGPIRLFDREQIIEPPAATQQTSS